MLYSSITGVFVNDIYVDLCELLSLGCTYTVVCHVKACRKSPERDSLFEAERLTIPEESIDGFLHTPHIRDIGRRRPAVVRFAEVRDHFEVL